MISDQVYAAVDRVVPPGVTHIGFVAVNEAGQFLLTLRESNPHGVTATIGRFPVLAGKSYAQTLAHCLNDKVRHPANSAFPLGHVWVTQASSTFYFAGLVGGTDDLPGMNLHWLDLEEALRHLEESPNASSRRRDQAALRAAAGTCVSPYRRVLLMVRELHRLGYERLRAPAYMYPIAWRCPVVPASWTRKDHGGLFEVPGRLPPGQTDLDSIRPTYSSAAEQVPFSWDVAAFDTPGELAGRFVRAYPFVATLSWGPDAAYADWLERVLALTEPHGIYYSHGEYQPEGNFLYSHMTRVERIPTPPPGELVPGEMERFDRRPEAGKSLERAVANLH